MDENVAFETTIIVVNLTIDEVQKTQQSQNLSHIFCDDMNFLPFLSKDLVVWSTQLEAQFILT